MSNFRGILINEQSVLALGAFFSCYTVTAEEGPPPKDKAFHVDPRH